MLFIDRGIVTVKEDGATAEACFYRVEGGFALPFRTFGARRELSVSFVRGLLGLGDVGEGLGFRPVLAIASFMTDTLQRSTRSTHRPSNIS